MSMSSIIDDYFESIPHIKYTIEWKGVDHKTTSDEIKKWIDESDDNDTATIEAMIKAAIKHEMPKWGVIKFIGTVFIGIMTED